MWVASVTSESVTEARTISIAGKRIGQGWVDDQEPNEALLTAPMRIWVDLTNSPHVLVMRPVIANLRERGHEVEVTARDFAQTLELLRAFRDRAHGDRAAPRRAPGRQGARAGRAVVGAGPMGARPALRPRPRTRLQRHHDRCGPAADSELDDVRLRMGDGPAQRQLPAGRDTSWSPTRSRPSASTATARGASSAPIPGLKEEYYLADFEPDRNILGDLGLDPTRTIAVVRTPPEVSLYHRFENDLFAGVLDRLAGEQTVVLPRTPEQRSELARRGGFIVPERAIDAQSLVAFADVVVSAGGTMNREAVALGTPVYTVFEGRLGAVDERLIAEGRLRRLSHPDELIVVKRDGQRAAGDRVRRDPGLLVDLLLGGSIVPGATFAAAPVLGSSTRPRRCPCHASRSSSAVSPESSPPHPARWRSPPPAPKPRRSARTPPTAPGASCQRRSCTRRSCRPTSRRRAAKLAPGYFMVAVFKNLFFQAAADRPEPVR